ncbi:MAG: KTSC domain-containing protein [Parapedobacter sp.]|nr:MAG: KTSC domain-containing protein [Parapedobacter sp.]
MIKSIYLFAVYMFFTVSCSAQDCNSLPQSFVSPAQTTQMIKKANFYYVDRIDTKKSSWIREAEYYSCDGKTCFFVLVMKTGGECLFQDMPIKVWEGFKYSESHGSFYNHHKRNKYQWKIRQ